MVLLVTSAWIEYFNDSLPLADTVEQLVVQGEAVLCPIVWAEFLQGVRSDRELERLKFFLQTLLTKT